MPLSHGYWYPYGPNTADASQSDRLRPTDWMDHLTRSYNHIHPALLPPSFSQRVAAKYHLRYRCSNHRMADCHHINSCLSMQPDPIFLESQNRRWKMHPDEPILLLRRNYKHRRHHICALSSSPDNSPLKDDKCQEARSRSLIHSWRIRRCCQHRATSLSVLHQAR